MASAAATASRAAFLVALAGLWAAGAAADGAFVAAGVGSYLVDILDTDKSGAVDAAEIAAFAANQGVDAMQARSEFQHLDRDGSGALDAGELAEMPGLVEGGAAAGTEEEDDGREATVAEDAAAEGSDEEVPPMGAAALAAAAKELRHVAASAAAAATAAALPATPAALAVSPTGVVEVPAARAAAVPAATLADEMDSVKEIREVAAAAAASETEEAVTAVTQAKKDAVAAAKVAVAAAWHASPSPSAEPAAQAGDAPSQSAPSQAEDAPSQAGEAPPPSILAPPPHNLVAPSVEWLQKVEGEAMRASARAAAELFAKEASKVLALRGKHVAEATSDEATARSLRASTEELVAGAAEETQAAAHAAVKKVMTSALPRLQSLEADQAKTKKGVLELQGRATVAAKLAAEAQESTMATVRRLRIKA